MSTEDGFIDVSKAQDGGVKKKITRAAPDNASGPPPNGNEITAHYTGKYIIVVCCTHFGNLLVLFVITRSLSLSLPVD
jgi:hypothetical protein